MLHIIRDSMAKDDILERGIRPFMLQEETRVSPTYFQLQFIVNGLRYRYGFEADQTKIRSEWLFGPAEKKETFYFTREDQDIQVNKKYFKEGIGLESKTKESNLFLNVADAFNGDVSKSIKNYFKRKLKVISGLSDRHFRDYSLLMCNFESTRQQLYRFLELADLGIEKITTKKEDGTAHNLGEDLLDRSELRKVKLYTHRRVYDQSGNPSSFQEFDLDHDESEGTVKIFNLAGAILLSLEDGSTLFIDEFDARLHPIITRRIVQMFNSPELNPKGAQLVFATHDTNLLDKDLLRRDQIYFAEKDSKGKSYFYSLYDIKGVRNDASFEKDYIKGKYGAIPFLGDFNTLLDVEKAT